VVFARAEPALELGVAKSVVVHGIADLGVLGMAELVILLKAAGLELGFGTA